MDKTEKRILKGLDDLPYDHLFKKDFECLIQDYLIHSNQLNKLIGTLEETLKTDAEYYWKDVCRANLLTFLYIKSNSIQQLKKATELNDECLRREPSNINGIACRVVLLQKDNKFSKSLEALAQLVGQKNEVLSIVAKAEIAYCLQYVGPRTYRNSIGKYEEILANSNVTIKTEYPDKIVMWKFHLAQTYSRLLNKGNLEEKLLNKGGDISETMSKIFALLNEVVESNNQDYLGKAYIDMADAVKKFETSAVEVTLKSFPDHLSADEYVEKALEIAPNDVYVLERGGRHYKNRATKAKEFKKAIGYLQQALKICPSRHVACHHIALAYKSLWLIEEEHDEIKLFTNPAKKGKKKSIIRLQSETQAISSAAAIRLETKTQAVSGSESDHRNMDVQSSIDSTDTTQGSSNVEKRTNKRGGRPRPTVPSRTRKRGRVQDQGRKWPDFFDKIRTTNPRCKVTPTNQNLTEAVKHLKNAIQYCPTSSRYHIDLGRLYISLRMTDEARRCFQNAKSPENFIDDNDAAYLYEQEGILEDTQGADIEDVKVLYRKAIMYAVKAKVRSKMAFYNLCDILYKQNKKNQADHKIELELNLLYTTMQQYEKSKQCLRESLKSDKANVKLTWELIRTMYLSKTVKDSLDAFRYLTILSSSERLNLKDEDEDSDEEDTIIVSPTRRRMILDLMQKILTDASTAAKAKRESMPNVPKQVFDWLIQLSAGEDAMEKSDVCVLTSQDTKSGPRIVDILKEICKLDVKCSFGDIQYGTKTRNEMINLVDNCKAVIIVVDKEGGDWKDIEFIANEYLTEMEFNVCVVFDNDQQSQATNFMKKWPRITVDDKLSDDNLLICGLYRAMLDSSQD